jgi:hypothetical protein
MERLVVGANSDIVQKSNETTLKSKYKIKIRDKTEKPSIRIHGI